MSSKTAAFALATATVALACSGGPSDETTHAAHGELATPDPLTCAGYPEPRVFLESQAWWTPTPGQSGDDFGHVHVGTCFPLDQTLSGSVDFDIRIILHDNPGTLHRIRPHIAGDGFNEATGDIPNIGLTCSGECSWWFHTTMDTSVADHDGRQEFRFLTTVVEPDGQEMHASTGWQAYLANGKPVNDYRPANYYEARGWYTGADYTNAQLRSPFPFAPISGVWKPTVHLKPGAGGIPVTHHSVHVDPSFHHGNPGVVIRDANGQFTGTVSIDTTQLSDGAHKLVLKADADCQSNNCGSNNNGQRNSGLFIVPFVVANGTSSSSAAVSSSSAVASSSASSSTTSSGAGGSGGAPPGGIFTVVPDADAYVRGGSYANTNFGSVNRLYVKDASDTYTREAFLRFDLGSLALGASVSSAKLLLDVRALSNGTPVTLSVGAVTGDGWSETGVTWNARPSGIASTALDSIVINAIGWVELDVTTFVNAQLAGSDMIITLRVFSSANENRMIDMFSRESGTSTSPLLEITP